MKHYAILRNPGHNQVFFQSSANLAMEELHLMGLSMEKVALEEIAGLSYLCFSAEDLSPEDHLKIARLSSTYGLFQREDDCLRPIPLPNPQILDRSLATILKYQGKTNEIFTRMLLNIAYTQANVNPQDAKILDPVAGRGTTLFEGFSLGSQVYGVECNEKSVSDGYQHLKKFLEMGKIKHKTKQIKVSGPNKSFTAKRFQIEMDQQQFQLVAGDSKFSEEIFSQNFFHCIVGDLPYGVQHGNQAGGLKRSPAQLLASCGKSWHNVLRKDGVLVLSWNTLVLPREKMEEQLERSGFQILKNDHLSALGHTVDTSIYRDVVVAKKNLRSKETP